MHAPRNKKFSNTSHCAQFAIVKYYLAVFPRISARVASMCGQVRADTRVPDTRADAGTHVPDTRAEVGTYVPVTRIEILNCMYLSQL